MTLIHSAATIGYPDKLMGDKYWHRVNIEPIDGDKLKIRFGFNRSLINEIKAMEGARWNPDGKFWTFKDSTRNWFQLAYLAGHNPYAWYDRELLPYESKRPLYSHQMHLVRHGITYQYVIWAAEMGLGKSLAAIEVMEYFGYSDALYVGPNSALASFLVELDEWESKIRPHCVTYDGLKRLIASWRGSAKPPRLVLLDESSRVKNPTAQRSQAALQLTEAIRQEHGDKGVVIEMTGTPAPKSPADYFFQCEVAMPGFIKEGTYAKFKARLCVINMRESITGGMYPHLVTWKDSVDKCNTCGELRTHDNHISNGMVDSTLYHEFVPGTNEVALLYERMKGLVEVKFKKDCLKELPDKTYREIILKPTQSILNAARLISKTAATTISGLTLLRELSDGFQYQDIPTGVRTCDCCYGCKEIEQHIPIVDSDKLSAALDELIMRAETVQGIVLTSPDGLPIPEHLLLPELYSLEMVSCWKCGGEGTIPAYTREAAQVSCPKDEALKDILESHDDDGRLVVYGGFTGTIDRITDLVERMGWQWIRVDGRGWKAAPDIGLRSAPEMLRLFQRGQAYHPRVCFIGQPSSAGMGLTLTASSEIVYFSNDFNGESRAQSEDRCHRPGMDLNKGCTITDLIHLPSDKLILDNLKAKRRLELMSLGQYTEALLHFSEARKV